MTVGRLAVFVAVCALLLLGSWFFWVRDWGSERAITVVAPGPSDVRGSRGGGSVLPTWIGRVLSQPAQADVLEQAAVALQELNLRPDFDLTPEQKQKLHAVKNELDAAQNKWRQAHADDFKKLDDAEAKATAANRQPIIAKRQALWATSPRATVMQKVKAILTAEQAKLFDTKLADIRAMEEGGRRGRGGPGGGRPGQR